MGQCTVRIERQQGLTGAQARQIIQLVEDSATAQAWGQSLANVGFDGRRVEVILEVPATPLQASFVAFCAAITAGHQLGGLVQFTDVDGDLAHQARIAAGVGGTITGDSAPPKPGRSSWTSPRAGGVA